MDTTTTQNTLLLRGPEVAVALGISRALAYRWMADGTLPVVRIGRSVRVPHAALVEWVRARTQTPSGVAA
jgi:excisionase family DNA binding protein